MDCLPSFAEVFSGDYWHPRCDEVLAEDGVTIPRILDIGGNVGAFCLWAKQKWPNAYIDSFEPNPSLEIFHKSNLTALENVRTFQAAVTNNDADKVPFFDGLDTRLCGSVHSWERTEKLAKFVNNISASKIPFANIVKIDTEGSEADIVENLTFVPQYLVLEWHSNELRIRCAEYLLKTMVCIQDDMNGQDTRCKSNGLLKFVRIEK